MRQIQSLPKCFAMDRYKLGRLQTVVNVSYKEEKKALLLNLRSFRFREIKKSHWSGRVFVFRRVVDA